MSEVHRPTQAEPSQVWGLGTRLWTVSAPPTAVPEVTIALDPGRTIGCVVATYRPLRLTPDPWLVAELVEPLQLWKVLNAYKPRTILYEKFDPEHTSVDLSAVEVIGVIKLWVATYPWVRSPFLMSSTDAPMPKPDRRKVYEQPRNPPLISNEMLKTLGLWAVGLPHGRAAMRQLLFHLIRRLNKTELLEWTKT